ncbi:ATP-binding cassette domain-containing protein [Clostridium estertheticum]|nr:ATP-binding cassette domain-containing protein [Clostridium estertheticum]
MNTNNYILRTKKICKTFKKQCAVNNISLSIEKNSVYGFLGPNGEGKSTLLKMVTGMLHPTSGEIIFQEHPWYDSFF